MGYQGTPPTQCVPMLERLRGDTVCDGVVVVAGVVTHLEPTTARFERIGGATFLVRGKVLPRFVASDREELPGAAFEVLQKDIPGYGLARAGRLADGFFQLVTMPGRSAKHGHHIDRPATLGWIVQTHGPRKLGPGRTIHKAVAVPGIEIACPSGCRTASGVHSGLSSEMLNGHVIPILATLMAQDDKVSRHRCQWGQVA
jgi:hypothetical protein